MLYTPCHECEWEATALERRELAQLVLDPLPEGAASYSGLPLPVAAAGGLFGAFSR